MLATYRYKHIFLIHPECFNSGLSQAKRFLFSKRAAQRTLFTSNAFFRIKQYYFFHKSYSIIFVLRQISTYNSTSNDQGEPPNKKSVSPRPLRLCVENGLRQSSSSKLTSQFLSCLRSSTRTYLSIDLITK